MPEIARCNSVIFLLRASFGITTLALSFMMRSIPPLCSVIESVLRELVNLYRGELSLGVACFLVCNSSAAAFA